MNVNNAPSFIPSSCKKYSFLNKKNWLGIHHLTVITTFIKAKLKKSDGQTINEYIIEWPQIKDIKNIISKQVGIYLRPSLKT